MDSIKQHQLYYTHLNWCQPSVCLYFPNIPLSRPPQTTEVHIRTNILIPTCSVFPFLQQSTYKSALYHRNFHCATFHSPIHRVCPCYFFTCTSAESWRCNSEGMFINFSQIHPQTCPYHTDSFRILVPLQHCSSTMCRFGCVTPSKTHIGLAASLQKHVEGVHHTFTQVSGTSRRQQGAEFEGFGDAVLIDVGQHVLIPLATQDNLGVVVIKVDL